MKNTVLAVVMLSVMMVGSFSSYAAEEKETAYERIMRTGTLRCAYVVWPPYLLKDPNSGKFSGLIYEYVSAIGRELDIKIEWAEEVDWGTFYAGLESNRYDMMCSAVWQSGQRAKIGLLSDPLYFNGVFAYARDDDLRFSGKVNRINAPDIIVAVTENDVSQTIRKQVFPDAAELSLFDSPQMFLSVITKKADVVLTNIDGAERFNAGSEKKIKEISGGKPVRLFANVFAMKRGENDLKNMIDSTVQSLEVSGEVRAILNQYEASGIFPLSPAYASSQTKN
jgi:ABC-type amino acid transport substrate-binding protein